MRLLRNRGRQTPHHNAGQVWSHAQRQAALQELEAQFQRRFSEEEVFRAAALFFSLLADASFIDKGAIGQEVQRQLESQPELTQEKKHVA